MAIDHVCIAEELTGSIKTLREGLPDLMKSFAEVGRHAYKAGALDAKTKELIALAIGITDRCDGCVAFHSRSAHRQGATREEVLETIGVAIHMGGGPSVVYGAEALRAFEQFAK